MKASFYLIVAALVVVVGLIVLISHPKSSPGIVVVAHNTAQLFPGQHLVVHNLDKTRKYWTVTFNNDGTVSDTCSLFCSKQTKELCGVGCSVTLDTGMFINSFKVSENADGTINVRWPDGYFRD